MAQRGRRRFSPDRLQSELDRKRWLAADLAKRSGVSPQVIGELLNGKTRNPRPDTLQRLADALGVDPGDFWEEPSNRATVLDLGRRRGVPGAEAVAEVANDQPGVEVVPGAWLMLPVAAKVPGHASQLRVRLAVGERAGIPSELVDAIAAPIIVRMTSNVPELELWTDMLIVFDPERAPSDGDLCLIEAGSRLGFLVFSEAEEGEVTVFDGRAVLSLPRELIRRRGVMSGRILMGTQPRRF